MAFPLYASQTKTIVTSFDSGTKSCYSAEWPGTKETYCDDRANGLGLDEVVRERTSFGRKTKTTFLLDENPPRQPSTTEFIENDVHNYVVHIYKFSLPAMEFGRIYYFLKTKGVYVR